MLLALHTNKRQKHEGSFLVGKDYEERGLKDTTS
jgi:hypothetical protein